MKYLLLVFIIPLLILAQDIDTFHLETINIYGLEIDNSESGKNTTIISSSDINNYSFHSVDELLKLIPSIEMQSRGGFGTQSDIVLRGTTFNQTLVLLDGLRINDPLTGHFSMYLPISPYDIHQIEIIRGGGSSIYGPDAVGGVINIITKSFKDNYAKNEIIAESKVGQNNLKGANLYLAKNVNDKFFTTLSFNIIKSDGQELYNNIFSFFDNQKFTISHRYRPSERLSFMLRSAYSKNFFSSQYYYTRSDYDLSNELIDKRWTQFQVNYNVNDSSQVNFYSSYQSVNDFYIFNPAFPSYQNYTELINSKIHYILNNKTMKLISGLDFQNRKITSIDRGDHKDYYVGGFINAVQKIPATSLNVNPSLRFDYNKSYGFQINPQIDLNFNKNNYNIRASVGRTIRSADFTERFYNNNYADTLSPGRNIGNPNLNAEKSINCELGFDLKKDKNLIFKNTMFYRSSTNLIDWLLLSSEDISTDIPLYENENYLFAQNISELKTLGLESEIWFNLFNNQSVKMNGSLGYTKIFTAEKFEDVFNSNYSLSSKYLANNSGDRFNYNVFFIWDKFNLNFNGLLKVRDNDSALNINQTLSETYFVHNFSLNYHLNKSLSCSVEVINVLNTDYADILGAIMPQRWAVIGVKYKL